MKEFLLDGMQQHHIEQQEERVKLIKRHVPPPSPSQVKNLLQKLWEPLDILTKSGFIPDDDQNLIET